MILLLWLGCAEPPPPAPPAAEAPAADPHAMHHGAGSDHMAKMAATRDGMRAALGEAYDAPVPGLAEANATAGKAMFEAHCVTCHGADGKGAGPGAAGLNPPPGDLTDRFHARFYSDAGRVSILRNGSPGTAMAGFAGTFTDTQILDLYAYVVTFRGDPATP
jgi:mono/diheme cytochrome c family protein